MSTTSDESDIIVSPDENELFHYGDAEVLIQCIGYTLNALLSHENKEGEHTVLGTMIRQSRCDFLDMYRNLQYDDALRIQYHNVIFDTTQRCLKTCETTERKSLMNLRELAVIAGDRRDTPEYPVAALRLAREMLDDFLRLMKVAKQYRFFDDEGRVSLQRLAETEVNVIEKWRALLQQLSRPCQEAIQITNEEVGGVQEQSRRMLRRIFLLVGLGHLLDEKTAVESTAGKRDGASVTQ